MNKTLLFIFPTKRQLDYIESLDEYNCHIYVVLKNNMYRDVNCNNKQITVLKESDEKEKIPTVNVHVFCGNEEALYWLKQKRNVNWTYPFSPYIFQLLSKYDFKKFLTENHIRTAQYCKNANYFKTYPIVAKPTIGFGSIGVKYLNSSQALKQYLQDYEKHVLNSNIKKYKEMYFSDEENFCFFEEYIKGNFYRTPFITIDNEIKYIFPIHGKHITLQENSDFHWTEFEYGDNEIDIAVKFKPLLQSLISVLNLQSGVFVAEFMITESGEIMILEMSPRQTSSRIARIVQLSSGLDLEKAAIDIFLNRKDITVEEHKSIGLRLINSQEKFTPSENCYVIETWEDKNVYGDCIKSIFYEMR